ncbi:COP9 signalosome complex subunit 3 [Senna tora]|uniref:COP9 signalosome complex subunit 3 n=1 Tax=Senna tora TaxID=362788 RepID=A0A834TQT1_9FABA|nr:COP9 signalosome complex subunit 3 [Senna tora]
MDPLEPLVAQIQALSRSDITRLHCILKSFDDLQCSDLTRLSSVLSQLDPSEHSLGCAVREVENLKS